MGAQAEVLGPSALVVVLATSVQVHLGDEAPEALSQVLPVDSTLALRSHARRITSPEEHDGYLFLDEAGGLVMLDAAGLEEAVAPWLADASGARTDGYLTANSQPALQCPTARAHRHQRAEAVADLGGQEAEAPAATLATDHSELVRLMSSLQQQVTEVAVAHPLQVPGRAATGGLSQNLRAACQSCLWGYNSRHLAWRGSALPLQHLLHYRSQRRLLPQRTRRPCSYRPLWRRHRPSHGSLRAARAQTATP